VKENDHAPNEVVSRTWPSVTGGGGGGGLNKKTNLWVPTHIEKKNCGKK
jgi:hypothetical protein